ncbi:unnamed protein product [Fusarium equiseti]|uniref:Uncharacterized protein n=1 Tax=Fusarium equiseti TaxID=61235 RepID=A0A8J2NCB0_FUSEQ|nr:unnamed protein product [Fusarium equiseti]
MIETTVTSDTIVLTTAESTGVEPTTTEIATTDFITTTAAPTTETTSNAPMPTFTMVVTGSGPVQGESLQSENRESSVTAFKVNYPGWTARTYTIDSQGRLINDQGWFLCGRYAANNFELKNPAVVSLCSAETPLQAAFLNCPLSDDLEVQCSIPAISCVAGQDFFSFPTCVAADGTWDIFSLGQSGPGNTLQIGGSAGSAAYPALSMGIQKV